MTLWQMFLGRFKDWLLIIDIHTHTYPTSDDSTLTPEELINEVLYELMGDVDRLNELTKLVGAVEICL